MSIGITNLDLGSKGGDADVFIDISQWSEFVLLTLPPQKLRL